MRISDLFKCFLLKFADKTNSMQYAKATITTCAKVFSIIQYCLP